MKENSQNLTLSNLNASTQNAEQNLSLEAKKERVFDLKKIETNSDKIFDTHIYKEPKFRKNRDGAEASTATYFKSKYGNDDCDIEIGVYDYGFFEKTSDGSIIPLKEFLGKPMFLKNGIYITRKDGKIGRAHV